MQKHARTARRAVAALWLAAGGLVHGSAVCASAAAPAPRLAVEEVLRQSARITWMEDAAAADLRVERRARRADGTWGDWVEVGTSGPPSPSAVVDRGAGGKGLTPGDYAYRAQRRARGDAPDAWSEWSAPVEFTLPPQCAGGESPPGNEASGALPTVAIDDLDGDRRYTGKDVWLALQRCSKLGGCVLEALPVTYDDVAISLWGGPGSGNFPCYSYAALICEPMLPFPKGLVIQGHGSATVFRSPIWKTPYRPSPIFLFWHTPGIQLRFRNFTLDGRKREQPDTAIGENDVAGWRHRGIDVTNFFNEDHTSGYPNGCVHNVTAHDFMLSGIEVDHARNWRIEYNRVVDVGCWKGLTECPLLTIPDTNPPPAWGCAGHKAGGYGIMIQAYTDDTHVVHNEISRVTKYALGFKGGADGISDPLRRLSVRDNRVTDVGAVGLFVAGTIDSTIERNLVDGTHQYGCRNGGGWGSWGIATHGSMKSTRIVDNELRNLAGVGIGSNAIADGLLFARNRIDNVCTERNVKVESVQAAIHFGDGSSGTVTLEDNSVRNNHCSMALAVCWGSQAQVVVDGGYYSTAENSDPTFGALYVESGNSPRTPTVRLEKGAVFEYLGSQRRPGIVASGNGRVVVSDDTVRVNRFRDPFGTARAAMDGGRFQKEGSVVRCAEKPGSPECL
jgi:hypothetical protein